MAQQTEAACLLDAGVLYGRRLLLRAEVGDPVFAGHKPGAFSLYFGDAPIFHFDLEGRWQRAYADGLHYLKALDGGVQSLDRVREGDYLVLKRRSLSGDETAALDRRIRESILNLMDELTSKRLESVGPASKGQPIEAGELLEFLGKAASWDAARWRADQTAYRAAYGPMSFQPPDSTAPLILQATIGDQCSRSFGGGPSVEFQARSREEFEAHARAVSGLLGRRVEQCKAVLLGGADALRRPAAEVLAALETVTRHFPVDIHPKPQHPDPSGARPHRLAGIHAFLDNWDGIPQTREAWSAFREAGLVRVCLGVESGDAEVLQLLGKAWLGETLSRLVENLKAAEIKVSLVLLVGAGGEEHAARHVDATASLVNGLPLGPGDFAWLVDENEVRGTGDRPTFTPLSPASLEAQREGLKKRLSPSREQRKVKVVTYLLDKQGLG